MLVATLPSVETRVAATLVHVLRAQSPLPTSLARARKKVYCLGADAVVLARAAVALVDVQVAVRAPVTGRAETQVLQMAINTAAPILARNTFTFIDG